MKIGLWRIRDSRTGALICDYLAKSANEALDEMAHAGHVDMVTTPGADVMNGHGVEITYVCDDADLCPWVFKSPQCGYRGQAGWCSGSFQRCRELGNETHFAGTPRECGMHGNDRPGRARQELALRGCVEAVVEYLRSDRFAATRMVPVADVEGRLLAALRLDRDAAEGGTKAVCQGTYENLADKRGAWCRTCGNVDYEANEGDGCNG